MDYIEEERGVSRLTWLAAGAVIGAVCGVLFAPRRGVELRGTLGDYARDAGDRAKGLVGRIADRIPSRVKTAAGFHAAKENIRERLS